MPKLLKDMRLDEISLVDEPASPGARIALFKRKAPEGENTHETLAKICAGMADDGVPEEGIAKFASAVGTAIPGLKAKTFDEIVAVGEAREDAYEASKEITEYLYYLGDAIRSIYADPAITDPAELVNESVQQFVDAVAAELSGSGDDDVEKAAAFKPCADCSNPDTCQSKGACNMADDKNSTSPDAVKKMVDEAIAKAKAEADAEVKKAKDEAAAAIAKANEEIAKINETRATEVRLAKARSMVEGLPNVTPEAMSDLMKGLDEAGLKTLDTIVEAAREAHKIGKSLASVGSDASQTGSVQERISKAAKAQQEKNPALSHSQAVTKALEADPKLYADYRAARVA